MTTLPRPRTALVHDWLTGMRGGEKVLESIGALFPTAPIYTLFHFPGTVSTALEQHPVHTSFLQSYPGARTHYRRYLPLFPAAIEDFDFAEYDLLISSSHCVAKGARPSPGAFHVCYCHTPMRYAWDQEQTYFPQRTGLVARLRNLALTRLRMWDVASVGRVDLFVANSSFVAERIQRYYDRQAEVVPPPVETDFFVPVEAVPGRYAVVVSALTPYKRIEVAIAACERLGLELRIVGTGPEKERLSRLADSSTKLLGYLSPEALREQLQGALCFLQPGVEDFGISSVEALASGCPIVALGRGGVLDIVQEGEHGILYQGEGDHQALAAAIDKCREISFNKLNLKRRAENFSVATFEDRFRSTLETRLSGWDLP